MTMVDHAPDRRSGRYAALVLFLVFTVGLGTASGYITIGQITGWYATLAKPSFNPPNWIFGPVWTVLYVFMGIAAWRVWRVAGLFSRPLLLFFAQFALNLAWSQLFFGRHQIGLALADIAAMWVLIVWTTVAFAGRDRLAAVLFVPYIAWISFAAVLNAAIWRLN